MEVSFSPLAATGKPLSRCGKCHRFMKYIQVGGHVCPTGSLAPAAFTWSDCEARAASPADAQRCAQAQQRVSRGAPEPRAVHALLTPCSSLSGELTHAGTLAAPLCVCVKQ